MNKLVEAFKPIPEPSQELQDAWRRLLLLDAAVEELKDLPMIYSDTDAQRIVRRMSKALRGLEL